MERQGLTFHIRNSFLARISFLSGILALTVTILVTGGCRQQDSLVVGTDASRPPFSYSGENAADGTADGTAAADYRGLEIEIARRIAESADLELEIANMQFAQLIPALQDERIDMAIATIPITEERKREVAFSQPYYEASTAVIVLQGSTLIREKSELEGKRIAVAQRSSAREDAGRYAAELLTFPSRLETIEALRGKEADCCMMEEQPAQLFAQSNPDLRLLPFSFPIEYYGIAVRKGDERLLESINTTLAELKASGAYDSLLRNYIR
jgi:polar amino acid transport system substrate-binding protein